MNDNWEPRGGGWDAGRILKTEERQRRRTG